MDKKEVIRLLYDLNKTINDCNIRYWEKSEKIQELSQDRPDVLSMVKEAYRTFSKGDPNGAKRQHLATVKYIESYNTPPPPPPPPETEPLKLFHLDSAGMLMDILEHGWEERYEDEAFERIEAYLQKVLSYAHPTALSFFSVIHSERPEHSHLNFKTPWIVDVEEDRFDFTVWNERYWELYIRFLQLLGRLKIQAMPQAFMREYYNAFFKRENNIHGIDGILDPNALWVAKRYVGRLIQGQLGTLLSPNIIFANEIAHGGKDDIYHAIANWHKYLWEHLRDQKGIPLTSIWADTSHSEATRAQLVYHGKGDAYCPKCGKYKWDNIQEYGRDCRAIKHSIGIIDDLERGDVSFKTWKGSANWGGKGSEDGSHNPDARIIPLPSMKWRVANPDQLRTMLIYVWTECKEAKKRKEYTWGMFFNGQHSLVNGKIKSYFTDDLPAVYWERLHVVGEIHSEIFKE